MQIKISPSLLASDFANLENEIRRCEAAGVDMIHIDVMDGHFVPNITIGIPVLKSISKKTNLPLDVHLMISHPLQYIESFAEAGADIITFHIESESDTKETIKKIKECGCSASVSVKPNTPIDSVFPYLNSLDMVLIMTVEPGFGGQKFMSDMMPKITKLRNLSDNIDIEVDGGIDLNTIKTAATAGANIFVAGSAIFKSNDISSTVRELRKKAEAGVSNEKESLL